MSRAAERERVDSALPGERAVAYCRRWLASLLLLDDQTPLVESAWSIFSIAAVGAAIGIASAFVHLSSDDTARALFSGLYGLFLFVPVLSIRWTGKPEPAAHVTLAMIALGLVVSPSLSEGAAPILLGLTSIPVAAAILLDARSGLTWTLICTAVLSSSALFSPMEAQLRTLAWNAAILCAFLGLVVARVESNRTRAIEEAVAAREAAEEEADLRLRAEASLRESQQLFSALFRRAPAVLLLARSEDAVVLEVNERFEDVLGWRASEVVGRSFSELGAWPSTEEQKRVWDLIDGEDPPAAGVDVQLTNRSGELLHLLLSTERVELEGRDVSLVQAIDITDRERTHRELEAHRLALEERVEERGRILEASLDRIREQDRLATVGTLAAGIAHQINNPIGAIAVIAEGALLDHDERGSSASEGAEEMDRILHEARRCGRIVRSILQFTRDEQIEKWHDDLNPAVERALRSCRDYLGSKGCQVHVDLCDEPLVVLMQPVAIEEIVVNLLRNAAEAMPEGGALRISSHSDGRDALLTVEDEGCGFAEEDLGRIFDPFFSTRVGEGGIGLGLSVVHGLVIAHDGRIHFANRDSGGARAEVRLPLAAPVVIRDEGFVAASAERA